MTQQDAGGEGSAPRYEGPWYAGAASGRRGPAHGPAPEGPEPLTEGLEGLGAPRGAGYRGNAPGAVPWPARPLPPSRPPRAPGERQHRPADGRAAVYFAVHRSAAFREVRRRHRRFVFPATAAFLLWYLGYVAASTAAPGLMGRPVGEGPLTVGLLAGLGQFVSTALLTCAYTWHARLRRDRAALDLRWETHQRTREVLR
ncbi:DUF485 domain-containing protein [Streptomyces sp. TRM 70351]|uniref:DUF485 domain-containing protein n=1 Tax=Streptomyces sp. TRM 70351 TaxID=3116552 RepID=UPI002E7B7CF2|nr:DUF485 domain-containing protein [Streptomyces sp. TRM 70351]MEE1926642.1 DUF485 domain-containing protein [Streptomyces sp. TRM 70351]